jgi:hypothetical protein
MDSPENGSIVFPLHDAEKARRKPAPRDKHEDGNTQESTPCKHPLAI